MRHGNSLLSGLITQYSPPWSRATGAPDSVGFTPPQLTQPSGSPNHRWKFIFITLEPCLTFALAAKLEPIADTKQEQQKAQLSSYRFWKSLPSLLVLSGVQHPKLWRFGRYLQRTQNAILHHKFSKQKSHLPVYAYAYGVATLGTSGMKITLADITISNSYYLDHTLVPTSYFPVMIFIFPNSSTCCFW